MGKEERRNTFTFMSLHRGRSSWQQQGAQRRLQATRVRAQCDSTSCWKFTVQPALVCNIYLSLFSFDHHCQQRAGKLNGARRRRRRRGARRLYCRRMTMHSRARAVVLRSDARAASANAVTRHGDDGGRGGGEPFIFTTVVKADVDDRASVDLSVTPSAARWQHRPFHFQSTVSFLKRAALLITVCSVGGTAR